MVFNVSVGKLIRTAVCAAAAAAICLFSACTGADNTPPEIIPGEPADVFSGLLSDYELVELGTEKFADVTSDDLLNIGQGGCTDGTYAYFILNGYDPPDAEARTDRIYKISMNTGKTVKVSEVLALDHGNDMTYNPDENMLYVVHNEPNYKTLSRVDPDTLKIVETFKLSFKTYGMAYVPSRGQYVFGLSGGYNFAITDSEFNIVAEYTGQYTGNTRQGVEADSRYIYFVQYDLNCLVIYDWGGSYQGTIYFDGLYHEPEHLFFLGQTLYLGTNTGSGGIIYKVVPVTYGKTE